MCQPSFRMLARRKDHAGDRATGGKAESPVTCDCVIKGYITASAKITRFRLVDAAREGINLDDYRAEFDYE